MSVERLNYWTRRCGWLVLLALCACGGGGGGGDSGGGGDRGGGDPQPLGLTGLVPAAPALGDVLVGDATQLRPLRDGALWVYQAQPADGMAFSSRVEVSGTGTTFTETTLGPFGEIDVATVTIANGTVTVREGIDVSLSGVPENISYVELRSPVRQGDQITLFERQAVQLGVDLDGDKVNDRADVAAYSRVIGWEDTVLPAPLSRTVRTVRLDVTLLLRVTGSSNGVVQPILSSAQSAWYLPGVGIVRIRTTEPSASSPGPIDSDEILSAWDGVTQGLGALSPIEARLPAGGQPPVALVGPPLAAAGLGDRAVVVNSVNGDNALSGVTVSMVSARGQTMSVNTVPGLSTMRPVHVARTGPARSGLIWSEAATVAGLGIVSRIRMLRLDAQGVPLDAVPGIVLADGVDGTEIATAYDGTSMWAMWSRYDVPSQDIQLVARAFDANGVPASPIVVLGAARNGGQTTLRLTAQPGRVFATWGQNLSFSGGGKFDLRVATFDAGGLLRSNSLGETDFVSIEALSWARLTPMLAGNAAVVAWGAPVFSNAGFGVDMRPRGVTLTAQLTPTLAPPGTPDEQRLAALALVSAPVALSAAVGDRVVIAQTTYDLDRSPQQLPNDELQIGFAMPMSPLTASSFTIMRWRAQSALQQYFGKLHHAVSLDDRVLLLGYQTSAGMMAVVAWPN
jgi:hypothetical protein